MTETTTFDQVIVKIVCRVCCRSGDDVRLASFREINAIQNLDLQKYFFNIEGIHLCIYCRALLRKFNQFVIKCQNLNGLLEEHSEKLQTTEISLTKSRLDYYYIGPAIEPNNWPVEKNIENWLEKEKRENGESPDHKQNLASETIDKDLAFLNDEQLKVEIDDDVPLSMFNDTDSEREVPNRKKRKKYAKEKIKKTSKASKIHIKREDKSELQTEGFSSRMVKETNEYVVIKLSKEQVKEELQGKLNQSKYVDSRYKCAKCAKGFNFEDIYNKHLQKHMFKKDYICCDICEIYCPSQVSMRGHMKSHTTRYKCKVCGCVRAGRQHLEEHFSLSHSAERIQYKCENCEFVTEKRITMIRHGARHKPSEGFSCEICAKICKSEEALRVHRIRHDTSKHYKCNQCENTFIYMNDLKKHVVSVHVRREYYCVECDKHFNSSEGLKNHFIRSKKHQDPSVFRCRACRQQFPSEDQLTKHLAQHKENDKFYCEQCEASYVWRDSLRSHIRRVHGVMLEETHPCTLCDKVFKTKSVLTRHRRTHTGERPYPCKECPLRFAQASTRDTHTALVHRKTGRRRPRLQ